MDRPSKRQKISVNDDSDIDFHQRRAHIDLRLKSAFELIFEKYGKDFTGIGDEIDLESGKIVVDHGHISGMRDEKDPGRAEEVVDELDLERWSNDKRMKKPNTVEKGSKSTAISKKLFSDWRVTNQQYDDELDSPSSNSSCVYNGSGNEETSVASQTKKFSHPELQCRGNSDSHLSLIAHLDGSISDKPLPGDIAIEPAWRAPPLPRQNADTPSDVHEMSNGRPMSPLGLSLWTSSSLRHPNKSSLGGKTGIVLPNMKPTASFSYSRASHKRDRGTTSLNQNLEQIPVSVSATSFSSMKLPWTKTEDQLLRHLKVYVKLSYSQILTYFPSRSECEIEDHWLDLHIMSMRKSAISLSHLDSSPPNHSVQPVALNPKTKGHKYQKGLSRTFHDLSPKKKNFEMESEMTEDQEPVSSGEVSEQVRQVTRKIDSTCNRLSELKNGSDMVDVSHGSRLRSRGRLALVSQKVITKQAEDNSKDTNGDEDDCIIVSVRPLSKSKTGPVLARRPRKGLGRVSTRRFSARKKVSKLGRTELNRNSLVGRENNLENASPPTPVSLPPPSSSKRASSPLSSKSIPTPQKPTRVLIADPEHHSKQSKKPMLARSGIQKPPTPTANPSPDRNTESRGLRPRALPPTQNSNLAKICIGCSTTRTCRWYGFMANRVCNRCYCSRRQSQGPINPQRQLPKRSSRHPHLHHPPTTQPAHPSRPVTNSPVSIPIHQLTSSPGSIPIRRLTSSPSSAPNPKSPATKPPASKSTSIDPQHPTPLSPRTRPLHPSTTRPLNPSTIRPLNPSTTRPLNPSTTLTTTSTRTLRSSKPPRTSLILDNLSDDELSLPINTINTRFPSSSLSLSKTTRRRTTNI